ncbi:MAG: hypothetical protein ACOYJB_09565 [Christensenellaceae bacterium]|jgi:hypothetical protein
MAEYDLDHVNEQDIVFRKPAEEEDLDDISVSFLRFETPEAKQEEKTTEDNAAE